jgi:hypothetical protein
MRPTIALGAAAAMLLGSGCSSPSGRSDAGIGDGGTKDAGPPDSGVQDAGGQDAGGPDAGDAGNPIPTTDETQYLDFVLAVGQPLLPPGPNPNDAGEIEAILDSSVASLASLIGATGDGRTRQLGFMVVVLPWIEDKDYPGLMGTVIAQSARVALARGVAFHLTIESHYFWQARTDLWNFFDPTQPDYDPAHVANVEWTDWAQTGFRWRFADWGIPQELPAPHMCYLSAAVQSEVARLGGEIGTEVRAAMDMLADAGHPELFSGVTVDFEPSLDNYTNIDTIDPGIAQLMDDAGAPKVRLGYCAFTALGYSAANPPPDAGAAAALANQLFVESWAGAVANAGVPASRLYTHIAANAQGTPMLDFTNAPIAIAFVPSARPGWTSYPSGPLAENFQPLLTALAANGNPHWGGTEAAPFDGTQAIDAYEYLRRFYGAGATVVVMNVGATGSLAGQLENAVYSPAAIAGYQRFLDGH